MIYHKTQPKKLCLFLCLKISVTNAMTKSYDTDFARVISSMLEDLCYESYRLRNVYNSIDL